MPATLEKPLKTPAVPDGDFLVFEDRPIFCEHTASDGTVYDRKRLQELCDNQNRRISETGDFTPIIVGHTPDKYELRSGAAQPEVIGLAGPFKLGLIGHDNPKWAILGRFHVYREDERKFRKHPRCSVELWPDEGFFDPISVLGAETPKLELGMHYSRDPQGRDVRRYTAVAPGGTNVFAPSTGDADDKPKLKQTYSAEPKTMALSPEDIGQIVEALKSTAEFQWIQAKMQAEAGDGDGLDADADAGPTAEPAGPPTELATAPPAKAGPPVEKPDDETDKYAADCDPEDEPPTGGDKDKYSKEKPMPDSQVAAERDELKVKYAKAQKDARDYKDRYERLAADVESLKHAKRRADRQSALFDLANAGYQFDADEELTDCDGMDDKGWEKHLERIRTKYARAPIGRSLPQEPAKKFAKSEQDSIDLSNKAKAHALEHGLSYAAALKAVQKT